MNIAPRLTNCTWEFLQASGNQALIREATAIRSFVYFGENYCLQIIGKSTFHRSSCNWLRRVFWRELLLKNCGVVEVSREQLQLAPSCILATAIAYNCC